ncbi:MAG: hypothetical protein ACI8RD_011245, partial [Bacillariaceae sp.]
KTATKNPTIVGMGRARISTGRIESYLKCNIIYYIYIYIYIYIYLHTQSNFMYDIIDIIIQQVHNETTKSLQKNFVTSYKINNTE